MHQYFRAWAVSLLPDAETAWTPSVDVYRTPTGWILKFDLAGVRREDVTVAVRGRVVRVSGHRRDWTLEEGCSYYSMEISYSRFERTVEIPCELGGASLEMQLRDGILLLRIHTGPPAARLTAVLEEERK